MQMPRRDQTDGYKDVLIFQKSHEARWDLSSVQGHCLEWKVWREKTEKAGSHLLTVRVVASMEAAQKLPTQMTVTLRRIVYDSLPVFC